MEEIFGIKSDINSVINMAEDFLSILYQIREQHPSTTLNPNYVNLLNQIFKSPDIMMLKR